MTITINENELMENKEARQNLLDNINVLDSIKELLLLPGTELMTTKMVSDYYEVTEEVVRKSLERNKNELIENGVKSLSEQELRDIKSLSGLKTRARVVTVFSKRAVLNIGMLLRDSVVAKRLRTALLDQQEVMTEEQKIYHIDKEKELALKIMFADSEEDKMSAFSEYRQYKNRHIDKLESDIKEYKPKAESYNHFMDAKGNVDMNNASKVLKVGRTNLFKFLREDNIKVIPQGKTIPYQKYIDSGYFVIVEKVTKSGMIFPASTVTPKGIEFLSKKLRENIYKYDYLEQYIDLIVE